ncbi:MAG TPA: hypothetical protein VKA31_03750, partial [Mariprofundaceae bacterium]|nr:hypothetical protein [Mariprofundaceae bacterium]
EADESNNLARLDAVNGKKPVAVSHAQKKEPGGNINLSITVNREPVRAEIKVVKLGETRYVYWTHYQPGGPALPSPIQLTLPAGTYDIHIKPDGPNLFIEKTMALEIKSGGTLDKSINLQAGHLEVDAQAGAQAVKAPISILQHGVPLIGAPGSFVYTPFNADLAPGHYTLVVTNPKDRWKESVEIRIDAEKTAKKTVIFSKQHAGFIKIRLLMDGQEIPSETFTSFADVKVLDAGNQKEVVPISGGYGAPALLPSGTYDIHVTQHVIGGSKTVFKAIRIVDGQTVDKSVTIPGSGELKLAGRWTHQPTNLADCAHYNNPFNAAHLGALMGGPSVSRGKCLDPVVQKMTMWVSTPGRNDGNVGKIEGYNVPRKLIAGMYDITVWPVDHRELAQTLKGVEIPSGGVVQKELNFRWPDQKR